MQWALINKNNVVVNLIHYEAGSTYVPPDNLNLQKVEDWISIGDLANSPQAAIPTTPIGLIAKDLLSTTDQTMNRIQEAISLGLTTIDAADVIEYINYRRALRALIGQISGDLPQKPNYPFGT